MTPDERIAAIRERVDHAGDRPWMWDTTHREIRDAHNDIIVTTHDADAAEFIAHAPDDIDWLLTYTAALRDVAEAALRVHYPDLLTEDGDPFCPWCDHDSDDHEEDCSWCAFENAVDTYRDQCTQSALQRWKGVVGT